MFELERFVGKRASLVSLSSSRQACELKLAACFRGNVLLFSRTANENSSSMMQLGRCFQVCFTRENIIYRYHAKIVRVCNGPYFGLKLMLPGAKPPPKVMRETREKVERNGIKILFQQKDKKIHVSLADISLKGARLVSACRLGSLDETLRIELPNNKAGSHCYLPCKICYVRSEISSGSICFHHGVEFLDLSANAEDFLLRFAG